MKRTDNDSPNIQDYVTNLSSKKKYLRLSIFCIEDFIRYPMSRGFVVHSTLPPSVRYHVCIREISNISRNRGTINLYEDKEVTRGLRDKFKIMRKCIWLQKTKSF